jgi:hypothetical protein
MNTVSHQTKKALDVKNEAFFSTQHKSVLVLA